MLLGVLVNTATVLVGSTAGLLFRHSLPKRLTDAVMSALAVCVIFIGISGLPTENVGDKALVAILAMALGTLLGTLIDIDKGLNRLGEKIDRLFPKKEGSDRPPLSRGFVSASLMFCVGAMTLVGCFESGLRGDHSTLYAKSVLDLVSSTMLAATLGMGVLLSALFVLVFQGGLVLLSSVLEPVLSDAMIADISMVGSLMILLLGLNILGTTKVKVANMTPALILAPFFTVLISWI